jgi:hypothetical protein
VSPFTVVFDSCVLYPAPLRDLLMHVAVTDLFRVKWTEEIHVEWNRGVLRDRPDLTEEQLHRTRDLMNSHVRDCLVRGYESLIPGLTLPDPDDRHVLAAAIRTGAHLIVTFNLKDFPADALTPYGIEAQHPDEFLRFQLGLAANIVCAAAKRHRASLRNPPKDVDAYLATLEAQGLGPGGRSPPEVRGLDLIPCQASHAEKGEPNLRRFCGEKVRPIESHVAAIRRWDIDRPTVTKLAILAARGSRFRSSIYVTGSGRRSARTKPIRAVKSLRWGVKPARRGTGRDLLGPGSGSH